MKSKVISAVIKLFSITIGFFANFYIASLLAKDDFGIFSAIVSLLSLCLVLSNMGLNFSIVDLFPKTETKVNLLQLRKKIIFFSICSSFIVGVAASIYALSANLITAEIPFYFSISVFVLIVLFQNLHSSNISTLRALQAFRTALSLESVLFNLMLVIAIYFLFIYFNIGMLFSFLLATLLSFLLSTVFSFKKIAQFQGSQTSTRNSKVLTLNFKSLLPFMLLGLVEVITTNLDVLLVRHFFGNEQTADYFLAKKMLVLFTFFWFVYNFIYTPKLSKLFTNSNQIDHKAVVSILQLKWPILLLSTVCMLIVNVLFDDLISFVNLEQYSNSKLYVQFFSLFAFIHILTGPVVSFLNVAGLSSYSFKVVSFGALIFLVTFYPMLSHYGVLGILISLNLSLLAWKVLGIYIIRKTTGFNLLIGSYINE